MKATVATVLFAAGALAVPSANQHQHLHRHAEADGEVQYVTQYVTNTAVAYVDSNGNPMPAPTQAPAPQQPAPQQGEQSSPKAWGWGGHRSHGGSWSYGRPSASPAASSGAPAGNSAPAQYSPPAAPQSSAAAPSSQKPAPSSEKPAPSSAQAPASSAAASSAAAPVASGSNDFQNKVLQAHNIHRQNHTVPDLQWGDGLAAAAQTVANKCIFAHDTKTGVDSCGFDGYGQNLACTSGKDDIAQDISGMWYAEEVDYESSYGLANPGSSAGETGHFTQVVWKSTTHVGCAQANCAQGVSQASGMHSLTVCNYGPPGNYGGQYAQNVLKPKGAAPTYN